VRIEHIVGRQAELAAVDSALGAVATGAAACVVQGEAGIGRSTIWEYGLRQADRQGWHVLSCRPGEPDTALSFGGLVDLLDGMADALHELPAPQAAALDAALLRCAPDAAPDHHAVCLAVLSLVRLLAASTPVLLAIDDAQWLDPASASVVTYLARRIHAQPVGFLVTLRCSDRRDGTVPFGLDQAYGDELRRIRLGGLAVADLRRLVRARTGVALSRPQLRRLAEASGGNPFLALEIGREMARTGVPSPGAALPVPAVVAEAVAARLATLPAQSQQVLLYAAALYRPTTELLRSALRAAGPMTPGLTEAEEAGLVEVEDGRIRFTRPGYAPAVYLAPCSERRRAVHRRLAEVVGDPEQRARHLALATDSPDASVADLLAEAARQAQSRGAPVTAAELWEMAGRRTPVDDPARHRRAAAGAACLFTAGDTGQAQAILDRAVAQSPPGPDQAYALLWLAAVQFHAGRPALALSTLERGLAQVGADRLLAARLQLRVATFAEHDVELRLAAARAARRLLDDLDAAPELRSCAAVAVGYVGFLAGHGIDRDLLDRGRALLPADGCSWEAEQARSMLAAWTSQLHPGQGRDGWSARYRQARDRGDEPARREALLHLVEVECWRGDWPLARRYAAELAAVVEESGRGRWYALARYAVALPAALRGDVETALSATADGLALAERLDDPVSGALHRCVRGFLELSRDDARAADRQLTGAARLLSRIGLREWAGYLFHGDHVEAVLAVGDLDRAGALLADLTRRAQVSPYPWLLVVSARSRAQVAMAGGDLDGALAAIRDAIRATSDLSMPFELARTQLVHGQILRRRRQKLAASRVLGEAVQTFTELGCPLWSAQAAAELDRLGLRRGSPDELTPTEEQVVRLVLDGRANDEVAAALYISARTVENHLSRIYRKLGIRSRAELLRAMAGVGRLLSDTRPATT
jgi:DNA-binding CsgD family transcriptional regulator